MLPNVDGLTILKTLKSRDETKDVPVIILTAKILREIWYLA